MSPLLLTWFGQPSLRKRRKETVMPRKKIHPATVIAARFRRVRHQYAPTRESDRSGLHTSAEHSKPHYYSFPLGGTNEIRKRNHQAFQAGRGARSTVGDRRAGHHRDRGQRLRSPEGPYRALPG